MSTMTSTPAGRGPRRTAIGFAAAMLAALAGCAVIPGGPSQMALPGTGRSFAQFRADDESCRGYANDRIGGESAQKAASDTVAGGAVAGAVIGAAAGAALGGSRGAGVGAGTGLIVGTAAGSGAASGSGWDMQRRYDHAYIQCMYANGHKVPVVEGFRPTPVAPAARPAQLPPGVPPPPAGAPPAPPPSAAPTAIPPPPPGAPPPPPPAWRPS